MRTLVAGLALALLAPAALIAGPAPATASSVVVDDRDVIEAKLDALITPALQLLGQNTQIRAIVRNDVARETDGDTGVSLTTVIAEAEESRLVDPAAADWQALKTSVAAFSAINGHPYVPQIFIPNWGDGVTAASTVVMTRAWYDDTVKLIPAYYLSNGSVITRTVDEAYSESNEVWVLNTVEPDVGGGVVTINGKAVDADLVPVTGAAGDVRIMANCTANSSGLRNDNGREFLARFRVPDPSSLESWFNGKLEMRLIVLGKDGKTFMDVRFPKIKRKNIKSFQAVDLYLNKWDRAAFGDTLLFHWIEQDSGFSITAGLGIAVKLLSLINLTADVKATFNDGDDDGGTQAVNFSDAITQPYSTGKVEFGSCHMGGDGGTGDDNFVSSAFMTASTTFPNYSVTKVNDGSRSTALGAANSWANGQNTAMPQWVQADFGVDKTFRRVTLYTTTGYVLRDFDVQVWNGATFVTAYPVRGNTAEFVNLTLPTARTSRLLRIQTLYGSASQPGYARINELEAYAS